MRKGTKAGTIMPLKILLLTPLLPIALLFLHVNVCASEKLMIIMLDGFRFDYVDRQDPQDVPNFTSFLEGGSRAEYVQTVFPSMSWASWTSIATGKAT